MSKRAEHTKAPWFIREYINGNGQACCEITCNRNTQIIADIPDYCFYDNEKRNNKANARLIRAAPDLLEALHEGRRAIGEHFAPDDCYATGPMTGDAFRDLVQCPACSFIAMYDEAIAKATGADHD